MKRLTLKKLKIVLLVGMAVFVIQYVTGNERQQSSSSSSIIHLVVESYNGHPRTGITDLALLQCWADSLSLNISIVEPYIRKSTIIGMLDRSLQSSDTMLLGDYFNIQHINIASHRLGMSGITTLNEALNKPLKKMVFVQMKSKDTQVLWSSDPENFCYNKSEYNLTRLRAKGYCILRIVAVEWSNLIKKNLIFVLGPYYNQSITLVVSKWEPLHYVEEKSLLPYCNKYVKHWLYPSQKLLNHAKNYKDKYLASKNTVAILVNLEHLLLSNRQYKKNTPSICFEKVTDTIKLHGPHHPVIADMGTHDNDTFNWFLKDKQRLLDATTRFKEMIPIWLNKQFSFKEWEDSFVKSASGIINPGYITALRETIAIRADCLVLVGGGTYQELVLRGYLHQHEDQRKWCLHFICMHNGHVLNKVVRSAKAGL